MTQEVIDKLHELEYQLHDEERHLRHLEEAGRVMFLADDGPKRPDDFIFTIHRVGKDAYIDRRATRDEAEKEYSEILSATRALVDSIKKEIAEL